MRVIRTTDTKRNLCDICLKQSEFPVCCPNDIEFGNGIGNDNITACSECVTPIGFFKDVYVGEISKLPKEYNSDV